MVDKRVVSGKIEGISLCGIMSFKTSNTWDCRHTHKMRRESGS
jgi:hypothetical protein